MNDNYYKYYTIEKSVLLCYKAIKNYVKIDKNDLLIEPSAGNGAFIKYISKLSDNDIFYDIKPEHNDIIKRNFLKVKIEDINRDFKNIHIIGNPPFGNKSSIAIKFIKHSAKLNAKTIAFILPISFNKASFKKAFPTNYHLIYNKNMPDYSFKKNNKIVNIKTTFQIWEKRDYKRRVNKKLIPANWYNFCKKSECDISIRRVGFSAGRAKICEDNDNENTNWFIKINITDKSQLYKKLHMMNKIKYNFKNNVGAYSISKQDIILKYNSI